MDFNLKMASVCTGIGAPEIAWKKFGIHPVWFSEIDKFPSAVLKYHYPEIPNLGDMTKLDNNPIYEKSTFDVLAGGTPCQSFSIAGLRGGLDDERGNLSLEYCRILNKKRPKWFVWENVPGVLSSNGGKDFACILSAFTGKEINPESIGSSGVIQGGDESYSIAWRILDAQYFGVPQRRSRVFVVGHIGNDWRPPFAVLFERESLHGYIAPRRKTGTEITGTYTPGAHPGSYNGQDTYTGHLVMATGQSNSEIVRDGEPSLNCNHEAPILIPPLTSRPYADNGSKEEHLVVFDNQQITSPDNRSNPKPGDPSCTISKGNAHNVIAIKGTLIGRNENSGPQGSGINESGKMFTLTKTDIHAVIQPQESSKIAGTLTRGFWDRGIDEEQIGNGNCAVTPTSIRRLTPLECERLQGFPDNHTKIPGAADGPRYKASGNSMARPVMEWIGRRLVMVHKIIYNVS